MDHVICGLIYGLLTEPHNGQKYFSLFSIVTNDGWFCALCNINMVLFELYPKLRTEVREQIFFFFREAIKSNVPKIDNVIINLIRNANDGADLKDICVTLSAAVGILNDNYAWLSGLKPKASMIPVALNTFARFISELSVHQQYESLRIQMITLCIWLLKERFVDCMQLGRDLLLVLMRLSKIPQFTTIWRLLLYSPSKLLHNFAGVEELMARPCAYNLPTYRICVTMQRKMDFLFGKMKPGMHEKHFEWFKKQHLANADSGSLRAELVRAALFTSWGDSPHGLDMKALFITFLLHQNSGLVDLQWCKLQLFWDWFCFDFATGGQALIEPGFAVLRNLFHVQPMLANSLLDFLVRMSTELHPPLQNRIINSVTNAFKIIGEHHVLGPISFVIDNALFQKNVRDIFRETFKGLYRQSVPQQLPSSSDDHEPESIINLEAESSTAPMSDSTSIISAEGVGSGILPSIDISEEQIREDDDSCHEKIMTLLAAIKEEFRDSIENLSNVPSTDNDSRCEMMQKLLTNIFENDDLLDEEQIELISECLLILFGRDLRLKKPLPEGFAQSPDILQELFNQPLFIIFRNLCFTSDGDATRQPLLSIIAEMSEKCSSISYLLLLFVCCGQGDQNDCSTSSYTDMCHILDRSIIQQIVADLEQCHIDDYNLFAYLVTFVYEKFANEAMASVDLVKLLAHSLDSRQVSDLIGELIRENISIFRKDSFPSILTASLSWETTAQFIFWQIVLGENVPFDWIVYIIPRLQYPKHSEAITHIYILLQRLDREPNMNLIRNLLSRSSADMFTVNCLKLLIRDPENTNRVAELLANLMEKLIQSGDLVASSTKGKRPNQRYVCLDQLFAHLDKFRQSCLSKDSRSAELFLARPVLQEAFTSARATDKAGFFKILNRMIFFFVSSLRIRYSELFAVMEILSDDATQSSRSLRRAKTQKRPVDTPEDDIKAKRKRQTFIVDSDSD
ncbi:unnamed protein product [Dracunculus medinensis]|uniref:SOSS complex subunit A homolog n=1 Tax=Dracunculus medinensis TaxID=318479 RepID=A0A0N4U785_DRAME|nr:unnamed protein product [Dracunculus medinensis]